MGQDAESLTDKQKRFVEEYLIDLNATQAAIRAGYSKKTAMEQGYQLLHKTSVQQAVTEAQEARSERTAITADRVLQELARIGFSDPREILTPGGHLNMPNEWSDETAAAISSEAVGLAAEPDDFIIVRKIVSPGRHEMPDSYRLDAHRNQHLKNNQDNFK